MSPGQFETPSQNREQGVEMLDSFQRRLTHAKMILDHFFTGVEDKTEPWDPIDRLEAYQDAEDVIGLYGLLNEGKAVDSKTPQSTLQAIAERWIQENALYFIDRNDTEGLKLLWTQLLQTLERRQSYFSEVRTLMESYPVKTGYKKFFTGQVYFSVQPQEFSTALHKKEVGIMDELATASMSKMFEQLPEPVRQDLLIHTVAIELNEGCTVRCNFCAFSAGGNIRSTMKFPELLWYLKNIPQHYEDLFLYYASDPLDYHDTSTGRERTYRDALVAFKAYRRRGTFTSTAYPSSAKEVLSRTADRITRLSVSHMNRKRLMKDGYVVITSLDGVIPTDPNLSEAMLFGAASNSWNAVNKWNPTSDLDVNALLYKRLNEIYRFGETLKFYNAGDQRARTAKMLGSDLETDKSVDESIACRDGVIISPTTIRNTVRLLSSSQFPMGLAESEIHEDHLNNGLSKIKELSRQSLQNGKVVMINDILPHCVICSATYSSAKETGKGTPKYQKSRTYSRSNEAVDSIEFVAYSQDFSSRHFGSFFVDTTTGAVRNIELSED